MLSDLKMKNLSLAIVFIIFQQFSLINSAPRNSMLKENLQNITESKRDKRKLPKNDIISYYPHTQIHIMLRILLSNNMWGPVQSQRLKPAQYWRGYKALSKAPTVDIGTLPLHCPLLIRETSPLRQSILFPFFSAS